MTLLRPVQLAPQIEHHSSTGLPGQFWNLQVANGLKGIGFLATAAAKVPVVAGATSSLTSSAAARLGTGTLVCAAFPGTGERVRCRRSGAAGGLGTFGTVRDLPLPVTVVGAAPDQKVGLPEAVGPDETIIAGGRDFPSGGALVGRGTMFKPFLPVHLLSLVPT